MKVFKFNFKPLRMQRVLSEHTEMQFIFDCGITEVVLIRFKINLEKLMLRPCEIQI
jgi:hypothetical protein